MLDGCGALSDTGLLPSPLCGCGLIIFIIGCGDSDMGGGQHGDTGPAGPASRRSASACTGWAYTVLAFLVRLVELCLKIRRSRAGEDD